MFFLSRLLFHIVLLFTTLAPQWVMAEVVPGLRSEKWFILDENSGKKEDFASYLYVFEDVTGQLTLNDITEEQFPGHLFRPYSTYQQYDNAHSAIWGLLLIECHTDLPMERILNLAPRGTNFATAYLKNLTRDDWEIRQAGTYADSQTKNLKDDRFSKVKFLFRDQQRYLCLIRVQNIDGNMAQLDVHLERPETYRDTLQNRNFFQGLFLGIIFIMVLYNLAIYLWGRDKVFYWYALYLLASAVYFLYYHGFLLETVFQGYPPANAYLYILSGAAPIFYFQFIRSFVQTREYADWLDRFLDWVIKIRFLLLLFQTAIMAFWGNFHFVERLSTGANLGVLVVAAFTLTVMLRLRRQLTIFLAIGSFSMILMTTTGLYLLQYWQLPTAVNFMQVGIVLEILFFSLGLGYRFKKSDEGRIRDQQVLILQLRQSEQERIELMQDLERKVEERTFKIQEHQKEIALQAKELVEMNWELYEKNEQLYKINHELEKANTELTDTNRELEILNEKLNQTLLQLKTAQVQLIQSEKMASVGLLTAGIAHEINNPINFVYAGADTLEQLLRETIEIVDQYNKISPNNSESELKAFLHDIEELKIETHFDENREDLFQIVADIRQGAKRTAEIVMGLRNFSRLDEDELKKASVHQGLESTLTLLRNQLKDRIVVEKDFDANMPEIECYPGQLNQVFMNIMVNAVHAVLQSGKEEGVIRLTTHVHQLETASARPSEWMPKGDGYVEIAIPTTARASPKR